MPPISYARHQFPPAVIWQAVWLYLRFTLSYRDVEELLAERGLDISYETIQALGTQILAGYRPEPAPAPASAQPALVVRQLPPEDRVRECLLGIGHMTLLYSGSGDRRSDHESGQQSARAQHEGSASGGDDTDDLWQYDLLEVQGIFATAESV